MTTIAVVKRNGIAAIASDTLTKWGSAKESAAYIANHEKILRVGESYIAITGSATFKLILRDYFAGSPEVKLSSTSEIFRAWNRLHAALKDRYFLLPEEDKEDALESSRLDVLIANPYGIFGVSGHRTVQEFSRFYAYGTGSDYALGALYASYDLPNRDAESLARLAIEAAAEFDDCTGLPLNCFTVPLLDE
ncbi:MAG TPA: MFS transporter [Burkholderiales bacterium]|nr:MFS transporter [Burkholderiales bacterium]